MVSHHHHELLLLPHKLKMLSCARECGLGSVYGAVRNAFGWLSPKILPWMDWKVKPAQRVPWWLEQIEQTWGKGKSRVTASISNHLGTGLVSPAAALPFVSGLWWGGESQQEEVAGAGAPCTECLRCSSPCIQWHRGTWRGGHTSGSHICALANAQPCQPQSSF